MCRERGVVSEDCVVWLESKKCVVREWRVYSESGSMRVGSVWCGGRVCSVVGVDGERVEIVRLESGEFAVKMGGGGIW